MSGRHWTEVLKDSGSTLLCVVVVLVIVWFMFARSLIATYTWTDAVKSQYSSWVFISETMERFELSAVHTWFKPAVQTLKFARNVATYADRYNIVETRTVAFNGGERDSWEGYSIVDCQKRRVLDAYDEPRLLSLPTDDPKLAWLTIDDIVQAPDTKWRMPDDPKMLVQNLEVLCAGTHRVP